MIQYINLYARLEPKKAPPLALIGMAAACLLVIVGYGAAMAYLFYEGHEMSAALTEASEQSQALNAEIARRRSADQAINLAPLEAELEGLKARLQRHKDLVAYLEDPRASNTKGFSAAMTGLARQHIHGVAIEKLELTEQGHRLTMSGKVEHPAALPVYMSRLGSETAFNQMSIEKINIAEEEASDGNLEFEIASRVTGGGDS